MDRFGQMKAHPLLPVERDARAAMLHALKGMNLDLEPLRDGLAGRERHGLLTPAERRALTDEDFTPEIGGGQADDEGSAS